MKRKSLLNFISKTGYKRNSPHVRRPMNLIPSGKITMKGVDFPLRGIDNLGNEQIMYPGIDYIFPGDYVLELPMMQPGGSNSNIKRVGKRKDEINYIDSVLNANKNLDWVQRLYGKNQQSIKIPGKRGRATHYMESADNRVYPTVVRRLPNSNLEYLGNNAYDYADSTKSFIRFPSDAEAKWFAENYKKGTAVLPKKQDAGQFPVPNYMTVPDASYVYPGRARAIQLQSPPGTKPVVKAPPPKTQKRLMPAPQAQKRLFPLSEQLYRIDPESTMVSRINFQPSYRYVGNRVWLPAHMKTIEEMNAEELARRKQAIQASQTAASKPFMQRITPENIALETGAIGDKFRFFPDEPASFIDEWLNPLKMIGDLSSGLARVPLNIKQGNYLQAGLGIAAPIAVGAFAGIGAKNTTQFLNNAFNPLAGTGQLLKTKTPLKNTYKQLPGSSNVAPVVNATPAPWSMQEMPGLHLKSTMSDGAVSKIVEPKTGLINVEQALGIIGKESGGADKVALIKQGLGETIPKKMDYNQFRKVVQDQLIPLERQFATHSSDYGIKRLGYNTPTMGGSSLHIYYEAPLENQTLVLGNKGKFGRGSSAHRNPDETLGHIHFLRDAETPDVLTVTQIQSDAFQGTNRSMPKSKEAAEFSYNKSLEHQEKLKEIYKNAKPKMESLDIDGNPYWYELPDGTIIYKDAYFEGINGQQKVNALQKAEIENFTQKQLLDKNHQERYLQELVDYAGKRGDINKLRLPTFETAIKVQGYTPATTAEQVIDKYNKLKGTDEWNVIMSTASDADKVKLERVLKGEIKGDIYSQETETILRKYTEQPKTIKKLFGQDAKIVTDSKGNTWYEFDIPESFKGAKGEIKAFSTGGMITPPAIIGTGALQEPSKKPRKEMIRNPFRFYDVPPPPPTYFGGTLPEVMVSSDEVPYPYYNQLTPEERSFFNDEGSIGRGVRSIAMTGKRGQTYSDLSRVAKDAESFAAEMTGIPGSIRFAQDPVKKLKGAGRTIEATILGSSPFIASPYNQEDVADTFDALDAFGFATLAFAPLKTPLQQGIKSSGRYLTRGYGNLSTGNSFIPRAWRSPIENIDQPMSQKFFDETIDVSKLSKEDKKLWAKYQKDSGPYKIPGTKEYDEMQDLISRSSIAFPEGMPLTRMIGFENMTSPINKSGILDVSSPTSFSTGRGQEIIGNIAGEGNRRVVIPPKYAKKLEGYFGKNPYAESLDQPLDLLRQEKEVVGSGFKLKQIGKVKNELGGYDYIMKPINLSKPKQLPGSRTSNSIMRDSKGQIQFLDNETYQDALKTGILNVRDYILDPRYRNVVEANQQLANRLNMNRVLPIQKEMGNVGLYDARVAKVNQPLYIQDPRPLETKIIQGTNDGVQAQYSRNLDGSGYLTIPRLHDKAKIIKNVEHEALHHVYPNLGEGFPSFTPLETAKAKAVFKSSAELRKIEQANKIPLWYLDDVDELVPNSFDLAKDLGIKRFQMYPGKERFKQILDSYQGNKKFIKDALKLNTSRDYKRAWDMLSGVRVGYAGAAYLGYEGLQGLQEQQVPKQKFGGVLPKAQDNNELFNEYKRYIMGDYKPEEEKNLKNTYDKLNRNYYKKAKESGMTAPNYIMSML